ncbi:hypothetical protein EDD22DRAFT_955688 [Suillus occidentalis]|nr:hypothetical protein EDD22DRAFT_955688 [Suillus occidentalis]
MAQVEAAVKAEAAAKVAAEAALPIPEPLNVPVPGSSSKCLTSSVPLGVRKKKKAKMPKHVPEDSSSQHPHTQISS